jgi:hypothetical protein
VPAPRPPPTPAVPAPAPYGPPAGYPSAGPAGPRGFSGPPGPQGTAGVTNFPGAQGPLGPSPTWVHTTEPTKLGAANADDNGGLLVSPLCPAGTYVVACGCAAEFSRVALQTTSPETVAVPSYCHLIAAASLVSRACA